VIAALSAIEQIDAAASEVDRLRKSLARSKQQQVRSNDDRLAIKATALAWFQAHSPALGGLVDEQQLSVVDECYVRLSESSERHRSREKYLTELKDLKSRLIQLRSSALSRPPSQESETPPDFSPLIGDPAMQKILAGRWTECVNCLHAPAPLAATVMMGGCWRDCCSRG
jgi:hypothetical protein